MPLETAAYISDLDPTRPAATDQINEADDILRMLKLVLKNSFPNFTSAPLSSTQAQLDAVCTKLTASTGQIRGPGVVGLGQYCDFPKVPARFTNGGAAAGGQAAIDYIEADGSVYNISDFPDLGGFLGSTYGGNGTTTFGVPNVKDTGRFRRSRTSTLTVGTAQANQNLSHKHNTSAVTNVVSTDHNHSVSGTTDGENVGHTHTYNQFNQTGTEGGNGGGAWDGFMSTPQTSDRNTGHTHTFTAATAFQSTNGFTNYQHSHIVTVTEPLSGGTEARPESIAAVVCIKT
jgi:microcystin-dependent protein